MREKVNMSKTTKSGSQGVENQGGRHFGLEPCLPVRVVDLRVTDPGHRPNGI